ncbi:MAG: chorismate-binding protein, partial [Propionibacteriaceae bacterium]|nr:chorismate-binding protein [Propionibacteriaceae bacterium]
MPADLHRSRVDFDFGEDAAAQLFGRLHCRWAQAPAAFLDSSDHARTGTDHQVGVPSRNRYSILAFCLGAAGQVVQPDNGPWQWLAQAWAGVRGDTDRPGPGEPPFQLGWVGFVGYENQGRFFRATHAVVIDHADHSAQLQSAGEDPGWEEVVRREIREMAALADDADAAATPAPLARLRVRDGRADYLGKIAEAQQQIRDGNSYEVCLTTAVTGAFTGSPWQAYLRLRARNRAPFTQYLHLPGAEDDVVILSASPERFMQITEAGTLRSEPIKGTRPRGADAEGDARLRQNLAEHPKDRAENVMITDLVRNDLSIYAVPGT